MAEDGRRPSYDADGEIRGYRSRPGAPQAVPQVGLTSSSNATPQDAWDRTFRRGSSVMPPTPVAGQPEQAPWGSSPSAWTPPPSSLTPEGPADSSGMASIAPRPFTTPRPSADSLLNETASAHSAYLGAAPSSAPRGTDGWVSPTQQQSWDIRQKYSTHKLNTGQMKRTLPVLARKMQTDYDSLFPEALDYGRL